MAKGSDRKLLLAVYADIARFFCRDGMIRKLPSLITSTRFWTLDKTNNPAGEASSAKGTRKPHIWQTGFFA
jgi:hypothetical protein